MRTSTALIIAFALGSAAASADTPAQHQTMVKSRGSQVMPFDQSVAMHMFTPDATGGTLEIMVHNMDPKQIALVRTHLRSEAEKLAIGNYSDPGYIHGKTMPGLQAMETNVIAVRYSDTSMGGRIVFRASDPKAIESVHQWLAAQARDHGMTHRHRDMKM